MGGTAGIKLTEFFEHKGFDSFAWILGEGPSLPRPKSTDCAKSPLKYSEETKDVSDSLYPTHLKFLLNVALNLAALHEHDMVWSDLKLENIALSEAGDVSFYDLGGARKEGVNPSHPTTRTPGYEAPECFDTPHVISKFSDLYSMGVVAASVVWRAGVSRRFPPEGASAGESREFYKKNPGVDQRYLSYPEQ